MGTDSAIIMVWPDQNLPPGQKREMGYAYGLGSVTVADPGGTLAVTLGGNYDIGQSFTITAYVNKPVAGQTLTLDLPPGLERIKGEQTQSVATPTVGNTSIISWEAKVLQTGVFPLKVRSSTGITQTKTITIARGDAPTGGKFSFDLNGSFEPGKIFIVLAKVQEPISNQLLTLHLPKGLERVDSSQTQQVPFPIVGSKDGWVRWQVRVVEAGKYPVRVSSSTGVAQTKTITIERQSRGEGMFQIALTGDFAPGKVFTVSSQVITPAPGQKLTLELPSGMERISGDETQTAQPNETLSWKVKIKEAGKFMVRMKSTTGITQRKTIIIEPPGEQEGRFAFDLEGDIRPGKSFRVVAQVTKPAQGQTLTLVLPKGLQLPADEIAQKTVALKDVSSVVWTVQVTSSGRLPVRIESSTGLTRTKTITLTESNKSLYGQ
jgi:predicted secreted protein